MKPGFRSLKTDIRHADDGHCPPTAAAKAADEAADKAVNTMASMSNPYKRAPQASSLSKNATMGPQSQRRLTLVERTHKMQAPTKKSKAGDQLTLTGERAFDPLKDCVVCKAKLAGREVHRGHHPLCCNSRRTKGVTSKVTLDSVAESERLRNHFAKPVLFRLRNGTKEAAATFLSPKSWLHKKRQQHSQNQ